MEPAPRSDVLIERLKALEDRLSQHETVQLRELQQAKETLERSRQEMDRRLAEMNEFRAQLSSERMAYVTRDMMDTRLQSKRDRIDSLERSLVSRLEQIEKWQSNLTGRMWSLGVGLSIAVVLFNVLIRFVWK